MKPPDRLHDKDVVTKDETRSLFGLVGLVIMGVMMLAAIALIIF